MKNIQLKLTHHAEQQMLVRGILMLDLLIVRRYGIYHKGDYLLTRKQVESNIARLHRWIKKHSSQRTKRRATLVKNIIRRMYQRLNCKVVVSSKGKVITAYHASKRQVEKFTQNINRSGSDTYNKGKE